MTLIEVIDAARDILNEPLSTARSFPDNSSAFWGDSTMTRYHNLVQTEVAQEIVQSFEDHFLTDTTFDISGNQSRYALPVDFNKVRRVEDIRNANSPVEIFPVRLNEGRYRSPLGSISGLGLQGGYHLEGDSIVFDSTPTFTTNSAVRMLYIKTLADVTAGSDSSELPLVAHRALVWGIVKYCQLQQQADNIFAAQEFEKHISNIRKQAENRQIQTPRRVYIKRRYTGL